MITYAILEPTYQEIQKPKSSFHFNSLLSWSIEQKRLNMVFYFCNSTDNDLKKSYFDYFYNNKTGLFTTTLKLAVRMFTPLAKFENLLIEIRISKNKLGQYSFDFNLRTKNHHDRFFGFHFAMVFYKDELNYTISQYNNIERQQIFNTRSNQVLYPSRILGFEKSHQHTTYTYPDLNSYGSLYEYKTSIPKMCCSCKYFNPDSLVNCAVNLTEDSIKLQPTFVCKDYTCM